MKSEELAESLTRGRTIGETAETTHKATARAVGMFEVYKKLQHIHDILSSEVADGK